MNPCTPGPWHVDGEFVYGGNIRVADTSLCDGDQASDQELDANARLIAAAPQLLSDLQGCVKVLRLVVEDAMGDKITRNAVCASHVLSSLETIKKATQP
jgi:hypothetical protein